MPLKIVEKIIIITLLCLVLNLVLIDVDYLSKKIVQKNNPSTLITPQNIPTPTQAIPSDTPCSSNCLSAINQAVSTSSSSLPVTDKTIKIQSRLQDSTISFGGGSSREGDWADLTGAAAYVDSTKYGVIKKVVFEAGTYIPNGNQQASVRLFNSTDKHPVWNSEVSLSGGTPQVLVSTPVNLDEGNKLYQVQVKTSLKDLVVVTNSNLKISTLLEL
jgi:hypothetical protein